MISTPTATNTLPPTHPPTHPHQPQVADIEAAEKDKMREKCDKIIAHGINCFVNRQVGSSQGRGSGWLVGWWLLVRCRPGGVPTWPARPPVRRAAPHVPPHSVSSLLPPALSSSTTSRSSCLRTRG